MKVLHRLQVFANWRKGGREMLVSISGEGNNSVHRTGKEESSSSSKNAANFALVLSMVGMVCVLCD